MRHGRTIVLAVLACGLALPGCYSTCHHTPCPTSTSEDIAAALPLTERGAAEADTAGVLLDDESLGPYNYYALTAADCQCRAVANSTLGNLLAMERSTVQTSAGRWLSTGDCLKLSLLTVAEAVARNHSAADALQLYYSIIEAEGRLDLIDQSQLELTDALAKSAELRKRGIELPFDDSELLRQRLELTSKRVEVTLGLTRANHALRRLLGMCTDDRLARIWPTDRIVVLSTPLNVENEVQIGMSQRCDVAVLQQASMASDRSSLNALRQAMGRIDGLLGMQAARAIHPLRRLLGGHHADGDESAARRAQMASYAAQQSYELAAQIRESVDVVERRHRQVAAAKAVVESWEKRVKDLGEKQKVEEASFAEITQARLKLYEARGNLLQSSVEWKQAMVRLREWQGSLLAECQCGTPVEESPVAIPLPVEEALPPGDRGAPSPSDNPKTVPDELPLGGPAEPAAAPEPPAVKRTSSRSRKLAEPNLFSAPPLPNEAAREDTSRRIQFDEGMWR